MRSVTDALPAPPVPLRARLVLAHAAVQRVAEFTGTDLLHVKGHAIDATLRFEGRTSSDVDVLVRPAHLDRFLAGLHHHGWRVQTGFEAGSAFEHAATLTHETWGYIDVHRYFPGITLPAPAAFEVLWRDRGEADLAGTPCPVPGIPAQVLILVLHAAPLANHQRGWRDIAAAWETAPPERQDAVRALVAELGAEVGFAAALGGLEEFRDHPEYLLWKVLSQGGTRIDEWRGRVAAAPTLGAKARIVLRAPLVNVEHLTVVWGRRPTRREIAREFFARPVRGLREEMRTWRRRTR